MCVCVYVCVCVCVCVCVGVCTGFVHFIHRELLDTFPQLIEQCHRRLIVLLTQWKTVLTQTNNNSSNKVINLH